MMRETLSPRERVPKAIDHEEPDRVPIDVSAVDEVMDALIEYYEIKTEDEQSTIYMGADGLVFEWKKNQAQLFLLEKLHVDFRCAWAPYIGPELQTYPDGSRDGLFGIKRGGFFSDTLWNTPSKMRKSLGISKSIPGMNTPTLIITIMTSLQESVRTSMKPDMQYMEGHGRQSPSELWILWAWIH